MKFIKFLLLLTNSLSLVEGKTNNTLIRYFGRDRHFIIGGYSCADNNTFSELITKNICECQNRCAILPACNTASITKMSSTTFLCKLLYRMPYLATIITEPQSRIYFKESGLDGFHKFDVSSGFFYKKTGTGALTWDAISIVCGKLLYGRMAVLKTVSEYDGFIAILRALRFQNGGVYIGMKRSGASSPWTWVDGTLAEDSSVFVEKGLPSAYDSQHQMDVTITATTSYFAARVITTPRHPICQLDPFN